MKRIQSIVIANRGEIACRIIRTCQKIGIKTIALFSDADANALYIKMADEAFHLPGNHPIDTYLNQQKIIEIALEAQADAIHPGYGFLSENACFAQRCKDNNLTFIGPHIEAIEKMGVKSISKTLMKSHGIPTIPGYNGEDQSIEALKKEARKIGFPILIKASSGGGGKGMRIVRDMKSFETEVQTVQREAKAAFDNDRLLLEKYIENARHIEIQIFGDQHGNVIPLFERECTIQRRYQKILEESPSPILSPKKREEMELVATQVAQIIQYDNAGTVEFIYSDLDDSFFFLEVNTRLQVEHPITEEISGLDLVKMQIESAEGQPLSMEKSSLSQNGYALEVRLYAEDVRRNYMPETGTILKWKEPDIDGLRIEAGIETGSVISPFYDPMIAKIIMHDTTRERAHRKMIYALERLVCLGVTTNKDFLIQLLKDDAVAEGKYHTKFLDTSFMYHAITEQQELVCFLIAVSCDRFFRRNKKNELAGWRNLFYLNQWDEYSVENSVFRLEYKNAGKSILFYFNNREYTTTIEEHHPDQILLRINGRQFLFHLVHEGTDYYVHQNSLGQIHLQYLSRFPEKTRKKAFGVHLSPIPAEVIDVKVTVDQEVVEGQTLFILSSMKMEIPIIAEKAGKVTDVFVSKGQLIKAGVLLIHIE